MRYRGSQEREGSGWLEEMGGTDVRAQLFKDASKEENGDEGVGLLRWTNVTGETLDSDNFFFKLQDSMLPGTSLGQQKGLVTKSRKEYFPYFQYLSGEFIKCNLLFS